MSSQITIKCERISDLNGAGWGSRDIEMDVEMTTDQMKQALAKFLEQITEAQWGEWVKEFAGDILEEAEQRGYDRSQNEAAEEAAGASL